MADPGLVELLSECGRDGLLDALAGLTLVSLNNSLDEGRPKLLEHLKSAGVAKLPDRQAIANGVNKMRREGRIDDAGAVRVEEPDASPDDDVSAPRPDKVISKGLTDEAAIVRPVVLRLFAIPPAGMGAWIYHGWQAKMPSGVELCPIELPSRSSRRDEPPSKTVVGAARLLVEELLARGALDLPYAIFGHSLGAWIGYEVVCELLRRNLAPPELLVVSAHRAPHHSDPMHDADRQAPVLHKLPTSNAFWKAYEGRYGIAPSLSDPQVRQDIEPAMRAAFRINETYIPSWASHRRMLATHAGQHGHAAA